MTLARLDHVTRRYGDRIAVDDVTLEIDSGSIVGLLGPNGAGKTTVLSLLQGLRRPTSGTVSLLGGDPRDARNRVLLGTTPQETALPETLRVSEVIDFVGGHFPDRVSTAELSAQFGLDDVLRRQCGALSGGQKRRVAVALAFVGRPRLVMLDEPTTGLDVDARRTLWDAIRRQHAAGTTVIVTSHYLEEIEALAERVVVMGAGRVLADDSVRAVLGRVGASRVQFVTDRADALAALAALPVVTAHERMDDRELFTVTDGDGFVRALVASGIDFRDLRVRGATLEEAFLTLTRSPAEAADAASPEKDA